MENDFVKQVKELSKRYHGLTSHKYCKLAYELTLQNNIAMLHSLAVNKRSGRDWLANFMKRNNTSL